MFYEVCITGYEDYSHICVEYNGPYKKLKSKLDKLIPEAIKSKIKKDSKKKYRESIDKEVVLKELVKILDANGIA